MCDEPTSSVSTTKEALKLFFPGQKILLRHLNGSEVAFTICSLSTPVTKSIVVLAKPDNWENDVEQVVIKIYDPRYLDERIQHHKSSVPSHPWHLTHEQAAARARSEGPELSEDELPEIIWSPGIEELSEEELATNCTYWEERYYRLMMECYKLEVAAYERLKDLQGHMVPRFIMAGQFLPPDERAIQPPAVVLEYIPSISLHDISPAVITPDLSAQVVSAIESFPLHGVIHNDITLTNIRFAPPEEPVRVIVIDFGCAVIPREDDKDNEELTDLGESNVWWAKQLLEKKQDGNCTDAVIVSRFM